MKKSDYLATAISAISAAIVTRESIVKDATNALSSTQSDETSDEYTVLQSAVKSALARLKEVSAIERFTKSDEIVALCYAHRINFAEMLSLKTQNTRELRKRFVIVFNAISLKNADVLKSAEHRFFSALASKRLAATHTLEQSQRVMQHQTTTQASYMKNFLLFFNAAKYDSETREIEVDLSSAFVKKVVSLFA